MRIDPNESKFSFSKNYASTEFKIRSVRIQETKYAASGSWNYSSKKVQLKKPDRINHVLYIDPTEIWALLFLEEEVLWYDKHKTFIQTKWWVSKNTGSSANAPLEFSQIQYSNLKNLGESVFNCATKTSGRLIWIRKQANFLF